MCKVKVIVVLGLLLFLCFPAFAQKQSSTEETFTITTYYPSPYGSYNELTTYSNTYLATRSGRVGIGTSSPTEKLTVTGTIETTSGGIKFPDGTMQTTAVAPTTYYEIQPPSPISTSRNGVWYDWDLSSFVPEGTIGVEVLIRGGQAGGVTVGVRRAGTTTNRILPIIPWGSYYAMTVQTSCSSSRHIEIYTASPYDYPPSMCADFTIVGYWK